MDVSKKLIIEFPGIKKTIEKYTSGNVINHLNVLGAALDNNDIDTINYCLQEIVTWYDSNINAIHSNEFCTNKADHDRNKALLEEIQAEMKSYTLLTASEQVNIKRDAAPVIFLSHCSSDKLYADALAKFIVGLGIRNDQLIYTSHSLHKIPLDANIYEYLRDNIHKEIFMIILWSEEYLQSPACLNEMGAAWVAQSDYTNIFVPSFDFRNPKFHECAVDTRKMGVILNGNEHCKASMIELKNKIQGLFGLNNDEAQVAHMLNQFIGEILEIAAAYG
jgi:hypothetical protein